MLEIMDGALFFILNCHDNILVSNIPRDRDRHLHFYMQCDSLIAHLIIS